jgi:hypothetical protein
MVATVPGVLEVVSTGEYRDERLYLLETVKRQEKKLDATLAELAVVKAGSMKFLTDLNRIGDLVRGLTKEKDKLQSRVLRMEIKAGSIAAIAGMITAAAIQLLMKYLAK